MKKVSSESVVKDIRRKTRKKEKGETPKIKAKTKPKTKNELNDRDELTEIWEEDLCE